jgi:hypothetical protein
MAVEVKIGIPYNQMPCDKTLIGSFHRSGGSQNPAFQQVSSHHFRIKGEGVFLTFVLHL